MGSGNANSSPVYNFAGPVPTSRGTEQKKFILNRLYKVEMVPLIFIFVDMYFLFLVVLYQFLRKGAKWAFIQNI